MTMNNAKLLSDKEIEYLNDKFIFSVDENGDVVVENKYYNRRTVHDYQKTFSLNTRVRKITFNPEIIRIWKEFNTNGLKCTLFDVKQAVTKLYISYQELSDENIENSVKEEKK